MRPETIAALEAARARVIPVGTVSRTFGYQLDDAITERTACAVFVVSHMTVQHAMLGLEESCRICHAKNVPVIVDAASEYDLRGFLARGADLVLYSGRLRVKVLPGSGWTARSLADALATGESPVMVRDYQTDLGHIDLDPCNLHPGEAEVVARATGRSFETLGIPWRRPANASDAP